MSQILSVTSNRLHFNPYSVVSVLADLHCISTRSLAEFHNCLLRTETSKLSFHLPINTILPHVLANTNKSVAEIVNTVGYTDVKFFNKVFKRITGMTPRQFKQTYDANKGPESN